MNNLEQIEAYFRGELPESERRRFEAALQTDTELADEVAFYLSAKQVAVLEAREQRKAEWSTRYKEIKQPVFSEFRPWAYAAAASILLLLGFGWYLWGRASAVDLTDQYIAQDLSQLNETMDAGLDSLKLGITYYNQGRFAEAAAISAQLLRRDAGNSDVLRLAGLASLRNANYDLAITYFQQLGQQTELLENPGNYYEALARIKRGRPDDREAARRLLETVVRNNLSNKEEAQKLLNRL